MAMTVMLTCREIVGLLTGLRLDEMQQQRSRSRASGWFPRVRCVEANGISGL